MNNHNQNRVYNQNDNDDLLYGGFNYHDSEFDRKYAVYKKHHKQLKPKHKHLHIWLPTKKLLNEFDDTVDDKKISDECLHKLINTMHGNTTNFIQHLIEEADENEITHIYDILKEEKLKQSDIQLADDGDNKVEANEDNPFNILSSTSICNICSYLNTKDIESFKMVSYLIAIECLQEMRKYSIGIFNMNELIQQKAYKNLSLFMQQKTNKLIKQNRYSATTKFENILELWSKRYNIKTKNMLLLYQNKADQHSVFHGYNQLTAPSFFLRNFIDCSQVVDIPSFDSFIYDNRNRQFLLFDKSKMSIIYDAQKIYQEENKNSEPPKKTVSCAACTYLNSAQSTLCEICQTPIPQTIQIKKVSPFGAQCIALLHYFDFKRQLITFVGFIVIHQQYSPSEMVIYLENNATVLLQDYFESDDEKNEFIELRAKMKKFKICANTLMLYFGTHSNDNYMDRSDPDKSQNMQCWIFSLNDTHSVVVNEYLKDIRDYYQIQLNEHFYIDAKPLMKDIYKNIKYGLECTDLRCDIYSQINYEFEAIVLTDVMLEYICSFLMNEDIISLKTVSKSAALVCLREMRKIKINSLRMTQIENLQEFQDLILFKNVAFDEAVHFRRCHPSMTFDTLLRIWCSECSISMENMLLLVSRKKYKPLTQSSYAYKSNIYRPRHQQKKERLALKVLEVFAKDMEMMNKYVFLTSAISAMKNYTFLIADKTKLFKVAVDEKSQSPQSEHEIADEIVAFNQQLNDYRVEAQIAAIQKLQTLCKSVGAERTLRELFGLLNEYCFPTPASVIKKYHTIPPNKHVIKEIVKTVTVEFIESCGLKEGVGEYIVPFLKKLSDETFIDEQDIRTAAQKMLSEIYDKFALIEEEIKEKEEIKIDIVHDVNDKEFEPEENMDIADEDNMNNSISKSMENNDASHDEIASDYDDESRSYDYDDDAIDGGEGALVYPDNSSSGDSEEKKSTIDDDEIIDINTTMQPDILLNEEKCLIILLYYFDLKNEKIEFCKTLMITENDNITIGKLYNYIMNNLHELLCYDDTIYDLVYQMQQFDVTQEIFKIYITSFVNKNAMQCIDYTDKDIFIFNSNKPFQVFVFQLNDDHKYLNYYCDINELIYDESIPITMNYSKNSTVSLSQCINYYQDDNKMNIAENEIDSATIISHEVTPGTSALLICKKIEKALHFTIPLQCIVIYNETKKYRIKWKQNMTDLEIFQFDAEQQQMVRAAAQSKIAWSIAPIPLANIHSDETQIEMYCVRIYEPNMDNIFEKGYESQLPHQSTNLFIPYKKRFTVHEFIAYIKEICHGLYENECQQYLKYFDHDQYSFVVSLSSSSNIETVENCFEGNNIIEFTKYKEKKISVFIINNNKYRDDEQYNAIIRFTASNDYIPGRPERIWFEKNDKITNILDTFGLFNSNVFYFCNKSNKTFGLNKYMLQKDKSIYDTLISPNNDNIHLVLLIYVFFA